VLKASTRIVDPGLSFRMRRLYDDVTNRRAIGTFLLDA